MKYKLSNLFNTHFRRNVWLLLMLLFGLSGKTQVAYEHISNSTLYRLIDELSALKIISTNSAIQPYSRKDIAQWLIEASSRADEMSPSLNARLRVFLKEFDIENCLSNNSAQIDQNDSLWSRIILFPPEVTYREKSFALKFRPVYGLKAVAMNGQDGYIHSYGGAGLVAYFEGWSVYANLRDNYITNEPPALPDYFTIEQGGNYKRNVQGRKSSEFSEMRGGITYSWEWGSIGLAKDNLRWGIAAQSTNILSGRTPSFPFIKLSLKPKEWISLEYFHAWLVSEVIDSTKSYLTPGGVYRAVFKPKYLAANMVTVIPLRNLYLSAGNSIIYSDVPLQPAYLIPLMFYKSIDHTLSHNIENQNSAMFAIVSSRQIKHLHIYANVFIDEFSISRIGDRRRHNFVSYKPGVSLSDWPMRNTSFIFEFTHTNPLTFKHYMPTTTFESNRFNLGHYLRDNSREFYFEARWYPSKTLMLEAKHLYAYHGNEYAYARYNDPVDQLPILKDKTWSMKQSTLTASFHSGASFRAYVEMMHSFVRGWDVDGKLAIDYLNSFSPRYMHGKKWVFIVGFNLGY